jgi:mycothiol synthase
MRRFDATDEGDLEALDALRQASAQEDGQPPFSDQSLVDLTSGRRAGLIESLGPGTAPVAPGRDVGALDAAPHDARSGVALDALAVVTEGDGPQEAELVVHPAARRHGLGTRLVERLTASRGELLVWAHGDHPAARLLADRYSFTAVRELLQLRLVVTEARDTGTPPGAAGDGSAHPTTDRIDASARMGAAPTIDAFRPGIDDPAWLALNAAAFADHPEQGRITQHDLDARMAEAWFDPGDFLVARATDGGMLGFCWLKVERSGDPIGEFYAVGVSPAAQGTGLGRALTDAGLARLRATGIPLASLYVDADNVAAVSLYRSMGFETHSIDVQYQRPAG